MSLPNGCKIWLALGADLLAPSSNWTWTDVTAYVFHDGGGGVTVDIGYPEGSDEANPTRIAFLANNADGRWTPTNPAGAWFGQIGIDTPVKVTFDAGAGDVIRGLAYLSDLPLEWTSGGKFKTVPIEAAGILARLESADPLQSYIRRALLSQQQVDAMVAYWPMEDESASTRLVSAVPGQRDGGSFFNLNLAADEWGGGKNLPTLNADSYVILPVAPYTRPSPEAWTVAYAVRIPARPAATTTFGFSALCAGGTATRWTMELSNATPAVLRLRAYSAHIGGVEQLADAGLSFSFASNGGEPFGDQLAIQFSAAQNGTGVDWTWFVYHYASSSSSGTSGTLAAATLQPPTTLSIGQFGAVAALDGWTAGHPSLFAAPDDLVLAGGYIAQGGYGETTTARFSAQCDFGGVEGSTSTGPGTAMGFVSTDTLAGILRATTTLDGGLMYERTDGALYLLSLADLRNQSVALSVAYATQLAGLQPTSAVRELVNRATVSRTGGGSATADAAGALSPATLGIGRSKEITVEAQGDTDLPYYAQWIAALGTVTDYRYTADLQFHGKASAALSSWLAADVGDRIQITGPPSWLPPETIDTYLRGYTEHINRFEYTATLLLQPYRLYNAWTVEGSANTGRADTAGSRLLAPLTTSGTSATVGTYGDPGERTGVAAKWSTTSVPYDLGLRDAERVTCTAVSNQTPTFVAVGTAAHADYAAVTPGMPAGIAAGDLLLLLCSVRDSGFDLLSGVAERVAVFVGDQTGWTALATFGGVNRTFRLYGRTYTSGLAAPTVTPGGGAAGDTMSAQMAAFRGVQPVIHNTAIPQSNASAANIAYPGLGVVRNATVVLLVVQKDDDWTTLSTPTGFTKIAEPSSTLGSDQGLGWYYQIQTTATQVASGSITVTGGAAATSKAAILSLLGDVQTLTLTRNVNAVSGGVAHPTGTDVALWRAGVAGRP
jgi:hypothetical protein